MSSSQPDPHDTRPTAAVAGDRDRVTWLVLAVEGPAIELAAHVPTVHVRIVDDPRRFSDLLLAERPRVVVCAQPPAKTLDLELVARERRRRSGMRAIHLAPPDAGADRLAALAIGFDEALTTATPLAELAGRIGLLEARAIAAKAAPRSGADPVLMVGPELELDLAAHELRRSGAVVHLRPKEFGLLALLATNPGRAYTRRQLLDRVWGERHVGSARTIDVHVRWLRSKIEPDPEHPVHLVTVRGVGYLLAGPHR